MAEPLIVYRNSKTDPGWFWSRYTLAGTRIPPRALWSYWRGGDSVEYLAACFELTVAEVQGAIDWVEARRAAARRGWARRRDTAQEPHRLTTGRP